MFDERTLAGEGPMNPDWYDDDDHRRAGDNDDGSDTERTTGVTSAPAFRQLDRDSSNKAIRGGVRSTNTGVKGVINDRKEAQARKEWQQALKSEAFEKELERFVVEAEQEEEEEAEEEFLRRRRERRLAQLKQEAGIVKERAFGRVFDVGQVEFLNQVDQEHPDVYVVVHLYQQYVPACRRVNAMLDQLAIQFIGTKFLRMIVSEALPNYDNAALPTLQIYRGGHLQTTVVALADELGDDFTVEDVRQLLEINNVIADPLA